MKTRQAFFAVSGMIGAAVLYAAILYPSLPDKIPSHWNLRGEVDGWMDKIWGVSLMPVTMFLFLVMMLAVPATSRKYRVESFLGTWNYVMFIVTALMGYIHFTMLHAAGHPHTDTGRMLIGGIFLFFALIGNVMGRVQRNRWMGVRTPWTLGSDRVWAATHRLAGRLMVGSGLLGFVMTILGITPVISLSQLIVATLYPIYYSYTLYRKLYGNGPVS